MIKKYTKNGQKNFFLRRIFLRRIILVEYP